MATTAVAPVISLTTVAQRPTVSIDGVSYELRHPDEFPYLVYRNMGGLWSKAYALLSQTKAGVPLTPAQERELEPLLEPLMRSVLLVLDSIAAKLTPEMQYAVVMVFFRLLLDRRAAVAAAAQRLVGAGNGRRGRSSKRTRTH